MNVVAKIVLNPNATPQFQEGLSTLLAPTRAEPGCLQFDAYVDSEDPNTFWLVEEWTDQAALDRHYEQPYVRDVMSNYENWLAEPLQVAKLRPVG